VTGLEPRFLGPYRIPTLPPLFEGSATQLDALIRNGKLYLTLQNAIALALEDNLDVEAERYNITLAHTDVERAAGGGSTRGIVLGSPGTGVATTPEDLALGGLRVSTIYQAGVQLTLPLRNRVAEADAARDAVQLRQVQDRTEKVAAQIRENVETAVVALQTAQAAYEAASQSREYQSQLLDAERDKLSVGQSTDLAVLQNEAYLAQSKSTEIAARSNWMKARISLDYALGDLLEKNHVELDDAIRGRSHKNRQSTLARAGV